jgi:hypothetical protein
MCYKLHDVENAALVDTRTRSLALRLQIMQQPLS